MKRTDIEDFCAGCGYLYHAGSPCWTTEQRFDEAVEVLVEMVNQHSIDMDGKDAGCVNSGALSADADAMRLLARLGRLEIVREHGKAVVGRWIA